MILFLELNEANRLTNGALPNYYTVVKTLFTKMEKVVDNVTVLAELLVMVLQPRIILERHRPCKRFQKRLNLQGRD